MINLDVELNRLLAEMPKYNRERDQLIRNYMFWSDVQKLAAKHREEAKKAMLKDLPQSDVFEIETDNYNVKKTVSTTRQFNPMEMAHILTTEYEMPRPTVARIMSRCNTKESTRTTITVGDPE